MSIGDVIVLVGLIATPPLAVWVWVMVGKWKDNTDWAE